MLFYLIFKKTLPQNATLCLLLCFLRVLRLVQKRPLQLVPLSICNYHSASMQKTRFGRPRKEEKWVRDADASGAKGDDEAVGVQNTVTS